MCDARRRLSPPLARSFGVPQGNSATLLTPCGAGGKVSTTLLYNVVDQPVNRPLPRVASSIRNGRAPTKKSSKPKGTPVKTRPVLAVITTLALASALAACSAGGDDGDNNGGGGGDASNCTNEIKNPDAPVVTLWAWYPNSETVVDNFNEEHDDVQVCWTNAGAGGDAYDKVPDGHLGRQRCS